MANLSDIISRGRTNIKAFTYAVTNNPRYREREYALIKDTSVITKDGSEYKAAKNAKTYAAGTNLSFEDNILYDDSYAKVKLGNERGFINIDAIGLPKAYTQLINPVNISQAINDFILQQGCPINIRLFGEKSGRIYRDISYAVDRKININEKNYRANLILCKDHKQPIDDKNSLYISYRPRNRGAPAAITGKEFINQYVSDIEYNRYTRYAKTSDEYELAKLACFGPFAHTLSNHSLLAIDCFASGKPYFQMFSEGDYYTLRFKNLYLSRRYFPQTFLKSDYAPKLESENKKTRIVSKVPFI